MRREKSLARYVWRLLMNPRPRARRRARRRHRRIRRRIRRRRRRAYRRHRRRLRRGDWWLFSLIGIPNPFRIRQRDVVIIEKETGKSIEDMTEEELLEELERRGIEVEDLDDEEQEALDSAEPEEDEEQDT